MPQPVTLIGRTVRVEPYKAQRHAAELYAASHGDEREALHRYLTRGPFPDLAAFKDDMVVWSARPDTLAFVLTEIGSGRLIGSASYMRITPEHRCLEVGSIWLTPDAQRGTAATEAMYLLARHAFETLGYRRYEWKCDALNEPSRRAALRLGFRFEGIFRQHMIIRGLNRDTAWFAMIDRHWPALRAEFERWLDPGNFDTSGRQLSRLNQVCASLRSRCTVRCVPSRRSGSVPGRSGRRTP
jgi:RimJ/RimL family protein N-acetyltransferase